MGLSRLALAPASAEQVSFWNAATACWYCWGLTPGGGVGGIVVSVVAGTWAEDAAAGAVAAGAEDAALPDGAGAKPCGAGRAGRAHGGLRGRRRPSGTRSGWREPEGAAVPDGVAGVGAAAPLVISGRNRSCAVWPTVLAWSPLAPGTEMMIRSRPCGDDLGLGHAEAVDPALDDLAGLVECLGLGGWLSVVWA